VRPIRSRAGTIALGIALALASGPALAEDEGGDKQQQAPPRQHPDLVFADALGFSREWYDLAYQVLDGLEQSRKARPEDIDAAKLLRADLMVREAGSMRDRSKAPERIEEARKLYEDLAQKRSGTPVGTEASLRMGQIYLTEGDSAALRMKSTDDAETRAQARKEADEKFRDAEKYFSKLVEKYQDAIEPDDVYKLMVARFSRAQALYQLGELADKGKERDELLTKARDAFMEVNTEHGDQPKGYEAAIFLGLVQKDLGNFDGAVDAFKSAIALKDWFFNHDDGKYYFPDPYYMDIVARAFLFQAQTFNDPMKEYQKAADTVKKLFDILPNYQREKLGLAARLEEARARYGLGDAKKGAEICQKVIEEDANGPWGRLAKEIMTGGAGSGAVALNPDRRLSASESMIDRGRVPEGLNQLRLLISDLEAAGGDDAAKWLPTCWFKLGNSYYQLRRFDEAAAVFDALSTRFRTSELAPRALFYASICRSALNGARPTEFDKSRYLETLRRLSTEYPNDPTAKASAFLLGNERFEARDYPAAAREFEKVAPSAGEYYDAALYQIGLAYSMEARRLWYEAKDTAQAKILYASARSALEKAVRWADGDAFEKGGVQKDTERGQNLRKLAFRARCRLAEILLQPAVRDAAKALEAAQAAEAGLGQNPDPEMLADARLLVVEGYLSSGELDKAEAAQARLAEGAPESPRTARGERELAIEFDKAASGKRDEAKKANRPVPAEYKDLLARSADHYARWAAISRKADLPVPAADYVKAGDRLYSMALELNDLPETAAFPDVDDLTKLPAANRFGDAAVAYEGALAGGAQEAWLTRVKLSTCYGFVRAWQKAGATFEPLIASEKLLKEEKDENGKPFYSIDPAAVKEKRAVLLFAYADFGHVLCELAKQDRKLLDKALEVFARVVAVAPADSQLWWRSKYDYFAAAYEKGDYESALIGLRSMQRMNPNFDNGRFGLKGKYQALLKKAESKQPPGKGGK
jgi:tetratricopeptide (TPR) repeat protein